MNFQDEEYEKIYNLFIRSDTEDPELVGTGDYTEYPYSAISHSSELIKETRHIPNCYHASDYSGQQENIYEFSRKVEAIEWSSSGSSGVPSPEGFGQELTYDTPLVTYGSYIPITADDAPGEYSEQSGSYLSTIEMDPAGLGWEYPQSPPYEVPPSGTGPPLVPTKGNERRGNAEDHIQNIVLDKRDADKDEFRRELSQEEARVNKERRKPGRAGRHESDEDMTGSDSGSEEEQGPRPRDQIFACEEDCCDFKVANKRKLTVHLKRMHKLRIWACGRCGQDLSKDDAYFPHFMGVKAHRADRRKLVYAKLQYLLWSGYASFDPIRYLLAIGLTEDAISHLQFYRHPYKYSEFYRDEEAINRELARIYNAFNQETPAARRKSSSQNKNRVRRARRVT
ncbi:hypothetical protein ABW19_dt0203825 [Dactylella cylindrospora]|nr:hypothetical protein ABW19_dt0203825 [Dactylella cylindrospora]